jgi:hypothetical protein
VFLGRIDEWAFLNGALLVGCGGLGYSLNVAGCIDGELLGVLEVHLLLDGGGHLSMAGVDVSGDGVLTGRTDGDRSGDVAAGIGRQGLADGRSRCGGQVIVKNATRELRAAGIGVDQESSGCQEVGVCIKDTDADRVLFSVGEHSGKGREIDTEVFEVQGLDSR